MFGFISTIADALELIARGGGGGSGGGGGGGGGASGSGGGGGGYVALAGYVPAHLVSGKLRDWCWDKPYWIVVQIAAWIGTLVCLALLTVWLQGVGLMIGIGALVGTGTGLYGALKKLRFRKNISNDLAVAATTDAAWDESMLKARVSEVFTAYQRDWSRRDWQAMAPYMTPEYYQHASLMVAALLQAKRIDDVREPVIDDIQAVELHDSAVKDEDTVTMMIKAHAKDVLLDEQAGEELFVEYNQFTEYWRFCRSGETWLLDRIDQATANEASGSAALRQLAATHGYFYSLDWGWLLIPRRGDLFGSARFGTSDINNHIIGIYNQTYLLQLYTYNPLALGRNDSYLIAQTNVPKNYGRIVVKRKKLGSFFARPALRKISMEWGDFNKKYEVFASSAEGATSFELLHPVFMEKLEALNFEVNIEVVDNVVYLYAPHKITDNKTGDYETMLALLQEAYKQMRL